MDYSEAYNRLEGLRRLRPNMDTDSTAALLGELGDPHTDLVTVQIAGSNGKGSTARILDRILREAGHTVGCYTSPDLNDRRERITVDGRKIPKRAVVDFVTRLWPFIIEQSADGNPPTFFEVYTALALWYFERESVDVAILEVGIGGRLDATSVVSPTAAAVTSVSLEHTDLLGETVEEIARDKAQVAPADRPLVTAATGRALATIAAETDVVRVAAKSADSDIDTVTDSDADSDTDPNADTDTDTDEDSDGNATTDADPSLPTPTVYAEQLAGDSPLRASIRLTGPDWEVETDTPLLGEHQATNAAVAAVLARQLAAPSAAEIARGISNVRWPGRFEVMDDAPLTVLDGAHNPSACEMVARLLDQLDYDRLYVVFGALQDKDHRGMCRALPAPDEVFLASLAVERGQDTETLAAAFERETTAPVRQFSSVAGALDGGLSAAEPTDCVLVTGSLSTVSAARDRWTQAVRTVDTPTTDRARAVLKRADVAADEHRTQTDRIASRTLRLHCRLDEAKRIQRLLEPVGGSCAVSGVQTADTHVEIVLAATQSQYTQLIRQLRGRSTGCRRLARQLTAALDGRAVDGSGTSGASADTDDYPWHGHTAIMGILNVTPDSFHDGGEYNAVDAATDRAAAMVADGADIVDIGGESTRPGADPVDIDTELERVVPVTEALSGLDVLLSVDTRKPAVAAAALDAGADIVNDVTGLSSAKMRRVVANYDVPAVVMHSISAPVNPDRTVIYDDVVDDVLEQLTERLLLAERAGIDRSQLLVDPGLGFGKSAGESFALLDRLAEFEALGTPLLLGHSHKSMFKAVSGRDDDRSAPTVAATALAADRGVDVVRVHDVAPNVAAVRTAEKMRSDRAGRTR